MTRTFALAICAMLYTAVQAFAADLPNPTDTPGVVLTTDTAKVCKPGYPKTIRPSASYTNRLKHDQLASSSDKNMKHFEEDHLVSLEIGGDPRDPKNLWPQKWSGTWNAHVKDRYENFLHREICAGRMTIEAAQREIAHDWIKGYRSHSELPLP